MEHAFRARFKTEQRTKENHDYEKREEDGEEAGEEGEIIGDYTQFRFTKRPGLVGALCFWVARPSTGSCHSGY